MKHLKPRFTNFLSGKMHITCYWEDAVCGLLGFYLVYGDPPLSRSTAQGLLLLIAVLLVLPAWDCWKNGWHSGKDEADRMAKGRRSVMLRIAFLLLILFLILRWGLSARAVPVLYEAVG